MKQSNSKTKVKKGAASIYVVIFITLLFSILTVTFVRVILSNSANTENNDLSQSAYDAALSGVEDAKRAIEIYAICKTNTNPANAATCQEIIAKIENTNDCDTVKQIVYGDPANESNNNNTEVLIQENVSAQDGSDVETEDEAYTCVTIDPSTTDYRSSLSSANPVRVIQLKAEEDYRYVEVRWHSDNNGINYTYSDEGQGEKFDQNTNNITPPIISAGFIYPGTGVYGNFDDIPRSTVFLIPDSTIDDDVDLGDNTGQDPTQGYKPYAVKCDSNGAYACAKRFDLGSMPANSKSDYLILTLPYGQPDADFSVVLYKNQTETVKFDRAQYAVDSTGRANNVYRRVEARVEANDNYFPYPEFAVEISAASATDQLKKYFYVTNNCEKIDNGIQSDCPNAKNLNE